jgi:UDP:flavonoid glycosyltransferase YjiC (YdhE family)
MRILFSFVGGDGHFEPLVPIARAAQAAGHTVGFGCGSSMAPTVAAAGFSVQEMGPPGGRRAERTPLRRVDSDREDRDLRDRFARHAARERVPRLIALAEEWKPDVLVCDETDFGAMIAAECLGLPFATVLVIATGSFVRAEVVGEALNELRREHGLPPDPGLEMLSRHLVLAPFPPSYRDPDRPLPPTARSFRPATQEPEKGSAPAWASVLPGARTVYLTLGTVFNLESGDLLERAVEGLAGLPIHLIVTVGRDIDPSVLGPQPEHVHVERHLTQSSVLPHCDLVVCHGGSGSVIGALAHGLPLVLIPIGADQPLNAARCFDLGVARVLDAVEVSPEAIRSAVMQVLGDPSYRRNAEKLREEIGALPEPSEAVGALERLAEGLPLPGVEGDSLIEDR